MSDHNPYQAPHTYEVSRTWWDWLKLMLGIVPVDVPDIAKGDVFIYNGIAFFIDPDQQGHLYAASPSTDLSDHRLSFIIEEVLQELPFFLADHANSKNLLLGRRVMVRMIKSYENYATDCLRETDVGLVLTEATLSANTDFVAQFLRKVDVAK